MSTEIKDYENAKNHEDLFRSLKSFGLTEEDFSRVDKIEELKKTNPLLVSVKSLHDGSLTFGEYKIPLKKSSNLVMPVGVYLDSKRGENRTLMFRPSKKKFIDLFNRYSGQNLNNKRLLMIRNGGFGDLIFTQPILKYLKEQYPTCRITFAASPRFIPIFWDFPKGLIDEFLLVPFATDFLKQSDYHLTFEGAIERCKEAHRENCYDLFSKLAGIDIDHNDDRYRPTLTPKEEIMKILEPELPNNYIVVQIRASNPIRMMSQEKWAKLLKRIIASGKNIVVVDDQRFAMIYSQFLEKYKIPKESIFNLSKLSKSINFATGIISKSEGVVGIDSSFLHMGAALNKPVFGIYGPFKGDLRMRYYKNADWIETENACDIQPCFFHQNETLKCPSVKNKEEVKCIKNLDDDLLFKKIEDLMLKEK